MVIHSHYNSHQIYNHMQIGQNQKKVIKWEDFESDM
jgi:hypothetical protein